MEVAALVRVRKTENFAPLILLHRLLGDVRDLFGREAYLGFVLHDPIPAISRRPDSIVALPARREHADDPDNLGGSGSHSPAQTPPKIKVVFDLAGNMASFCISQCGLVTRWERCRRRFS